MTIENAIQKAIEGGYDSEKRLAIHFSPIASIAIRAKSLTHSDFLSRVLIDPLFWQCLGKALGWGDESECPLACCGGVCPINIPMWQSQWHRFISHLSGGKDVESFFENL